MQEHGLDNHLALETTEILQQFGKTEARLVGHVNLSDALVQHRVELHDIVFYLAQRLEDILFPQHRRIGEDGYLRRRAMLVANGDGIVDNARKIRVHRRLAVAREGNDIGHLPVGPHLVQFPGQCLADLLAARHLLMRAMVFIVPAFAINTIESTELPVSREQIHAEGNPQAAAVYRAVNDAIEYHDK